jgi:hypothetical protein
MTARASVGKGGNEPPRRRIDVDGNIDAGLLLVFVENARDFRYGLVVSGISSAVSRLISSRDRPWSSRAAQDDKDADGVFVNVLSYEAGV